MQDTIYTIPVTEVYEKPCECPLCALEARFENDRVNYYLGPSLMEPENRIATNDTGFCGRHFGMMYKTQTNRLGLGLILDTYMTEQIARLRKIAGEKPRADEGKKSLFGGSKGGKGKDGQRAAQGICEYWKKHSEKCCICTDLEKTVERYIDVIFHLYFSQKEFRDRFDAGQGYCMKHFDLLCEKAEKMLSSGKQDEFLTSLVRQQLDNLSRIQEEVNWFTKKFDYRNAQEPWKNSRDALPRGMRKMTGEREIGEN
ncbi:MAG: ABC transporter substrate-binding protein [Clostridia bacterium]|nr:ABC transporter substrate-binding protein [Clostridia bacterium]